MKCPRTANWPKQLIQHLERWVAQGAYDPRVNLAARRERSDRFGPPAADTGRFDRSATNPLPQSRMPPGRATTSIVLCSPSWSEQGYDRLAMRIVIHGSVE